MGSGGLDCEKKKKKKKKKEDAILSCNNMSLRLGRETVLIINH